MKIKLRIPGLGVLCLLLALIFSIIAYNYYGITYAIGNYNVNRWATMFTAIGIWCIAILLINSIVFGDSPVFAVIFYAAAAFCMVYAVLLLIQPCISDIGFVLMSPDLAMGDNATRAAVADNSITTAVFYVLSAVFVILGAFLPATWSWGLKNRGVFEITLGGKKTESSDSPEPQNADGGNIEAEPLQSDGESAEEVRQ